MSQEPTTPLSHSNPGPEQTGPADLTRTLDAIRTRQWSVVLLAARSKRPPKGGAWPVTTDADRVQSHVAAGGNVGLLCGKATGVAVLDPDKPEPWAEMVAELGEPGKAWVKTGSGRTHYYVAHEPSLPAKLLWNGQIIGEIQRGPGKQQVVIPPSVHPAGGRYEWLVDPATEPLQPLPGSWHAYLIGSSVERPVLPEGDDPLLAAALRQPGAVRRQSGVKFQCPACAAEGHDLDRDNAVYFPQHRTWGCAWASGSPARAVHRDAIAQALGVSEQKTRHAPPSGGKVTQSQQLVTHAAGTELFHDPDGDTGYVTFPVEDHRETWPIRSRAFKRWLVRGFFKQEGKPPSAQAIADTLGVLEATAQFDGPARAVHVRVAGHEDKVYVDLVNDRWEVLEVSPEGWRLVSEPPIKFRRARGMLSLPIPERGGKVDELRGFLNVASDADWRLVLGWLIGAFKPQGPYPVLLFNGEQGAGKSWAVRQVRALVDPNKAPLRGEPRDARDLMIAASNGWLITYDNVSYLPPWLSDVFCRLATGGGFGTRELYTDAEEILFNAQRPVILNGIEEIVTRGDLLDCTIILQLPRIDEATRRPEEDVAAAFLDAQPRVLGALLDAVSTALRNRTQVQLSRLPRMADFAKWVTAAEPALGWQPGAFMQAYEDNRAAANDLALEASPLVGPLMQLAKEVGGIRGNATTILDGLNTAAEETVRRSRSWPKTPGALANALRRLAPNLRAAGIPIEFGRRTAHERPITIGKWSPPKTGRRRRPNRTVPPPAPAAGEPTTTPNDVNVSATQPDGQTSPPPESDVEDDGDEGDDELQDHQEDGGA